MTHPDNPHPPLPASTRPTLPASTRPTLLASTRQAIGSAASRHSRMASLPPRFVPLLLCALLLSASVACSPPPKRHGDTAASLGRPREPLAPKDFARQLLATMKQDIAPGGGYDGSDDAVADMSRAVAWDAAQRSLSITPRLARPSFCSGACYLLLVKTLQKLQHAGALALSPEAQQSLAVYGEPDGFGIWGRANANGPGLAKLVHDLGAGVNFTDPAAARPGDFLKFGWTPEIGCRERGHLVLYLGQERRNGVLCIRYWSSNKPGGYGIRCTELSRMHNLLFTRITAPGNFNRAADLPPADPWLQDMKRRRFSFSEVCRRVGARVTP